MADYFDKMPVGAAKTPALRGAKVARGKEVANRIASRLLG